MSDEEIKTCGVLDLTISPALKVWIKQGQYQVCGIIAPGTSRTLSAKWDSPLEQTNVGSNVSDKVAGMAQVATGATSITTFSSTQIWQGNMPLKFSLNLLFFAYDNAYEQVMLPLQRLEEFASGEVKGMLPIDAKATMQKAAALFMSGSSDVSIMGRIPQTVTLNIGRRMIIPNCVIENITTPLDKEVGPDGDMLRAEVQLDIQTITMQNRSDIAGTWGR